MGYLTSTQEEVLIRDPVERFVIFFDGRGIFIGLGLVFFELVALIRIYVLYRRRVMINRKRRESLKFLTKRADVYAWSAVKL